MKTKVQLEAYIAPITEVLAAESEAFIAASNSIGADSWTDGNSNVTGLRVA